MGFAGSWRWHQSSCDEEPVPDKGGGGGFLAAAREAGAGGRRRRHLAAWLPWSTYGEEPAGKLAEEQVTGVVSGVWRTRGDDRRRRRRQEPGLVDEEQLGLPQRAAAGGEAGNGAHLHAAVPRRRRQRLTGHARRVYAILVVPRHVTLLECLG